MKLLAVCLSLLPSYAHADLKNGVPPSFRDAEQRLNDRKWALGGHPISYPPNFPATYLPWERQNFGVEGFYLDKPNTMILEGSNLRVELFLAFTSPDADFSPLLYLHPLDAEAIAKAKEHRLHSTGARGAWAKSSVRSLVIDDPQLTEAVHAKLHLGETFLGLDRSLSRDELYRAHAVNEIAWSISQEFKDRFGIGFIYEPLQIFSNTLQRGMLVKDFELIGLSETEDLIPAFALSGEVAPGKSLLTQMIEKSGESPLQFVREKILRPFIRATIALAYLEGLVGQPHQQNVLLVLDERGLPTGRIIFRDLEAFRIDIELRDLLGLDSSAALNRSHPANELFLYGFDYYNKFYSKYILDNWAGLLKRALGSSPETAEANKDLFYKGLVHEIFLEEVAEILQIQIAVRPKDFIPFSTTTAQTTATRWKQKLRRDGGAVAVDRSSPIFLHLPGFFEFGQLVSGGPAPQFARAALGRETLSLLNSQGDTTAAVILTPSQGACAAMLNSVGRKRP